MPRAVPHKPDVDLDVSFIPPYNVILWNDDDHSYQYVMKMLFDIFGHSPEKSFKMAQEVDMTGRVVVFTGAYEHAEFKRDRIHSYGPDPTIERCSGSMSATVEKAS
jgi:ATP-dependent Clp protease adaptor protein ClpS